MISKHNLDLDVLTLFFISSTVKHYLCINIKCTGMLPMFRVWNVEKPAAPSMKVLPHPTYVYAAKFHPRVTRVVVTGCYDHILRIWSIQGSSSSGEVNKRAIMSVSISYYW